MVELGVLPGGTDSYAWSVNASGQVVGFSSAAGGSHGFLWTQGGGMQDLGTLPGGATGVTMSINDAGEVVGYGSTADGHWHAFIWTQAAGMQDLGAVVPGGEQLRPGD